jgi:hypothetical protein
MVASPPPPRTNPLALNPLIQGQPSLPVKLRLQPLPLNLSRNNQKKKLNGEPLVRVEKTLVLSKRSELVSLEQGEVCYQLKAVR